MGPIPGSIPSRLLMALQAIHVTAPRLIASPTVVSGTNAGASRRASVAIIIRLRPQSSPTPSSPSSSSPTPSNASPVASSIPLPSLPSLPLPSPPLAPSPSPSRSVPTQLEEFFAQPWVNDEGTTAEILFIKRASRATDKWSGHMAFPGGRQEAEDEDERYTAMRETWEEVGLDLAEKEWLAVGQLDDREITTSLGKRLLMILSPFVFLHTSPHTPMPELQASEVASAHWIPIEQLHAPQARYGAVGVDISSRLAPRSAMARFVLKLLIGSMYFRCILLPNNPCAIGQHTPLPPSGVPADLKLWGLTLGMTNSVLSSMSPPAIMDPTKGAFEQTMDPGVGMSTLAPDMASIFPRFSYPDINFLIYVFGWRYRRMISLSTASKSGAQTGGIDPRVNWAGMSLSLYYGSIRRALVAAVLIRGLAAAGGLGWVIMYLRRRYKDAARGLVGV